MGKKIITEFGLTPTDHLVKAWLTSKGIDPGDVRAYQITRGVGDIPTIVLTMCYSEEAVSDNGVPS